VTAHLDPHPSSADLAYTDASDLARALADGTTTSVDAVRVLLSRIDAVDGPGDVGLGAVIAVCPDAVEQAQRLDAERAAGRVRGPLHGVPVLVKDNVEVLGMPATAGSLALAGRPAQRDAPIVARLREAGLVILGVTNLSEWANIRSHRSTSGWSAYGGLTGNPWALDRSAGGSSSGSGAAVAAGLAPLAIGTETDGSITCPSSLNGVVGLKPTVGLVPTEGIVPISASQDMPGPMGRSVRDVALGLDALTGSGQYADAAGSRVAASVRLGVADGWLSGHPETDQVFLASTQRLFEAGMTLVTSSVTATEFLGEDELHVLLAELVDDLDAYLAGRPGDGVRSLADVVAFNRDHAGEELRWFGQEFLEQALDTGGRAGEKYEAARAACLRWAVEENLQKAFDADPAIDALVAPAYAPAWKSDLTNGDQFAGGGNASPAPSIAGWPVLALPMGFVDGLPVGLVLIGRPGSEAALIGVGEAVERALGVRADGYPRPPFRAPSRG
jgi:amidase